MLVVACKFSLHFYLSAGDVITFGYSMVHAGEWDLSAGRHFPSLVLGVLYHHGNYMYRAYRLEL